MWVKCRAVHLVVGKLHKEIRETEQDNVGVESAHKSEEAVETGAYLVREGYRSQDVYRRQDIDYSWTRRCEVLGI